MSDTQHDEVVQIVDTEAERDRERREARELAYQEVSLRAVELLASAQRAADEAVAEAQSYARDLEETARDQYRHILQRAHDAARAATGDSSSGEAEPGEPGEPGDSAEPEKAGATDATQRVVNAASGLGGQELQYVRTYARVAHSQLSAVLGALNDELERLAELADGSAPTAEDVAAGSAPADGSHAEGAAERHDDAAGSGVDAHVEPYGDGPDEYHESSGSHG